MSNVIKKLTDLNNPESFVQIDIVKGYKYIDRAGEIVNLYHSNDQPPASFTMGLEGLLIPKPISDIDIGCFSE